MLRHFLLLVALLLAPFSSEAELKPDLWRSAGAQDRLHVPIVLSNIFFVFHTKKPIMAYAGGGNLDDAILSSEPKKKEFIEGVLNGIHENGLVLKERKEVMINGVPATEAYFQTPATEATTLGVFCISGTRFITLLVFSKDPLTFKDREFTTLVDELKIKPAPLFRTDSAPELRPADIEPIR